MSGSVGAFWIDVAPAVTDRKLWSAPKIASIVSVVSEAAGAALFTSTATRGARASWVVAGFVTPTFRSNQRPVPAPAASSAGPALAGKISEPAGIGPPVVEVNGASAISP